MASTLSAMTTPTLAFIGGGNMASAILGGLVRSGTPAASFIVVEPNAAQRDKLMFDLGVVALPAADGSLARASMVVWAVKPQMFGEAAAACGNQLSGALQLSVMAGVRCDTIAAASGSPRVVRAMPNTPALIGRGIAGLYAMPVVSTAECARVEQVLAPTGSTVWVDREADLDAVTALSGSGPAYVFYFIEAMVQAGAEMGLDPPTARQLAQETFAGAAALAMASADSPAALRERVTSKGGTTHAAITSMEASGIKAAFVQALHAARVRAEELGHA
jgi:pyrroline-5-carboxylate reductase